MEALIITLSFVQYIPYFFGMWKGSVRPSVSGWTCYAISLVVTILASVKLGSLNILIACGLSFICQAYIIFYGLKSRCGFKPTVLEKYCLYAVVFSVMVWFVLDKPLWAIFINIAVDVVGTAFILKKLFYNPLTESPATWFLGTVSSFLAAIYFFDGTMVGSLFLIVLFVSNALILALILCQSYKAAMEVKKTRL